MVCCLPGILWRIQDPWTFVKGKVNFWTNSDTFRKECCSKWWRQRPTFSNPSQNPEEGKNRKGRCYRSIWHKQLFCPIKSFQRYKKSTRNQAFCSQKPVFRTADGKAYIGKLFNQDLKDLLSSVIDYNKMGKISSHSFRIGITTMLGKLGYSDEIMAIGRWSSSAFELYIRSPRAVRAKTAKRMAEQLAKM